MGLVFGVGVGTFLFIIFAILLTLILVFGHSSKTFQTVFWLGLLVFILVFTFLGFCPTKEDPNQPEIIENWYVLVFFSAAIFLGLIIAIVAFLVVVLLYQDFAVVIPT